MNKIKQWRTSNGLSQTELARRVGVSQSAVNQWESGHTRPSVLSSLRLERVSEGALKAVELEPAIKTLTAIGSAAGAD